MVEFKIGDRVDVIDRRDGAVIRRDVRITDLKVETMPGQTSPGTYADLSCGFGASVKCLRPAERQGVVNGTAGVVMTGESVQAHDADDFVPIQMVYAGRRERANGKPFVVFYDGEEDAAFDSPMSLKLFRRAVIGGVYEHRRKGVSFRFSDRFLRFSDDPRVPEWKAADEAVDVASRARKRLQEAKAASKDELATALRPFRVEYAKTDRIGRMALEVVLLTALRSA